jgi:hypothetical protein
MLTNSIFASRRVVVVEVMVCVLFLLFGSNPHVVCASFKVWSPSPHSTFAVRRGQKHETSCLYLSMVARGRAFCGDDSRRVKVCWAYQISNLMKRFKFEARNLYMILRNCIVQVTRLLLYIYKYIVVAPKSYESQITRSIRNHHAESQILPLFA